MMISESERQREMERGGGCEGEEKKMREKDGVDLPCLCRSDYLILYCADT